MPLALKPLKDRDLWSKSLNTWWTINMNREWVCDWTVEEVHTVFQSKFDFSVREDGWNGLTFIPMLIPKCLYHHRHHGEPLVYFILSLMSLQVRKFSPSSGPDHWGPSVELSIFSLTKAAVLCSGCWGHHDHPFYLITQRPLSWNSLEALMSIRCFPRLSPCFCPVSLPYTAEKSQLSYLKPEALKYIGQRIVAHRPSVTCGLHL